LSGEQLRSGAAVLMLSHHASSLDQPDGCAVADHQLKRREAAHGSGYGSGTHHCWKPPLRLARHYDIREIDEALYEAVLACRRAETAATAKTLGDNHCYPVVTARATEGQ
jgi:hypothetical protein